jgi:hypothetical protein
LMLMLSHGAFFLADSAHCVWEDEGNHAKLYLGPARAAGPRSTKSLIQAGVGAILHCTPHILPPPPSPHDSIHYSGTKFQSAITLGPDILTHFTRGNLLSRYASRRGTSVLVHCEMGVSRSATVCIAYLNAAP